MADPRRLSLVDCIAIGVNGIVGSGVYLMMAPLARRAGAASVAGIFLCGALCILIALCFAEMSGMFEENGGAYVYARAAFGRTIGFGVGWMSLAAGVVAFAAVAAGFADALGHEVPALSQRIAGPLTAKGAIAGAMILSLGGINYLGVKAGARTVDGLTVLKLLPLVALGLVGGLLVLRADVVAGVFHGSGGHAWAPNVAAAALYSIFMLSGFEFTAVPAGEAKNARRNIPIAIVGSVLGATVLYCLLQLVALSAVPDLGAREHPLPDVAGVVFGSVGEAGIRIVALVSMIAFCAGSALVAPRYFTALAKDGFLPAWLEKRSRFGTPGVAIAVATLLALILAMVVSFASLVDVTNVVMFAQYLPTTLAVIVLRQKMPLAPRTWRLPFGPVIPIAATAITIGLFFLAPPGVDEWVFSAEILAAGALAWILTAASRRWMMRA